MQSLTIRERWATGHTNAFEIKDEVLLDRLAETIAWCNHVRNMNELRSENLRPSIFHGGPDDLVCQVGRSRSLPITRLKLNVQSEAFDLVGGRLMLYFPDANLSDGVSKTESHGFFDIDNTPPYDTWVSFFDDSPKALAAYRSYVLCYVPLQFCRLAEAGMSVNAEDCIAWLENTDVRIKSRLRKLAARHL